MFSHSFWERVSIREVSKYLFGIEFALIYIHSFDLVVDYAPVSLRVENLLFNEAIPVTCYIGRWQMTKALELYTLLCEFQKIERACDIQLDCSI
jgi:hypothetical protein